MKNLLTLCVVAAMMTAYAKIIDSNNNEYKEIILSESASNSTKLAASELQKYIKIVGKVELPIVSAPTGVKPVIYVGANEYTKALGIEVDSLGQDGYLLKTIDNALVIAGREYHGEPLQSPINPWRIVETYNSKLNLSAFGESGTLYGVNAFLQDICDIRFYWAGDLGTVLPVTGDIKVPVLNKKVAPRFNYRYPWYSLFEYSPESALWFKRVGFGGKAPVYITHNYSYIQKYKDTNPEFFALTEDGKRAFTFECVADGHGHLCLNNDQLIETWSKDIIKYFEENPEVDVYPLGPNDGLNRICACDKCQADLRPEAGEFGEFSYHIWNFTNKVAQKVAERFPNKFVGCLAYEKYRTPPDMKLEPNVAVMFVHSRADMTNDVARVKLHSEIEAWSKIADRMYLWSWYLVHWPPLNNLPILYSGTIQNELRYLNQQPAMMGEFIESENPPNHPDGYMGYKEMATPAMQHLNLYITGKLHWNPELNTTDILAEYFIRFYGPAAETMEKFWTRSETRRNELFNKNIKVTPDQIFTGEFIQELQSYLATAKTLVPAESDYAKRIAIVDAEFQVGASRLTRLLQHGNSKMIVKRINGFEDMSELKPMRFMDRNGQKSSVNTWLYAGYDRERLFLRFVCFEPEISKIKTIIKENDGDLLWDDDCIDIIICPSADNREKAFQIIVNTAGYYIDGEKNTAATIDKTWDSKVQTKVTVEDDRWIVDVIIPFWPLGIVDPNHTGDLALNFYRARQTTGRTEFSTWSPTGENYNFVPEKFGIFSLEK